MTTITRFALLLVALFLPVQAAVAAAAPAPEAGQFFDRLMNPKIGINVYHNAEIGLDDLKSVIFRQVGKNEHCGPAAESIQDDLRDRLRQEEVKVLNRENLTDLVGELEFGAGSIYANPEQASKIGEMHGATVLISVDVSRCDYKRSRQQKDYQQRDGSVRRHHFATSEVFVDADVTVTDIATGEYLATPGGSFHRTRTLNDIGRQPQFPDVLEVYNIAYRAVALRARRALLPWTETREIVFYDDGECRMKEAHAAVKAGLNDRAAEVTEAGLDACRQNPKMKRDKMARALYNRGMIAVAYGQDEEALGFLQESAAMKSGDIVDDAIKAVRDRIRTAAEAEAKREEQRAEAERRAAAREAERQERLAKMLTNQKIIEAISSGLSDELIIMNIQDNPCEFDVSLTGMAELSGAGVSMPLINAMRDCMNRQGGQ